MLADIIDSIFSWTTLLWLFGSVMAGLILIGTLNRRRDRLTASLRQYVERSQDSATPDDSSSSED